METYRLFVYGTLKKGKGLNGILGKSEFFSDGWLKGFKMYGAGVPFVIQSNNPNDKVYGQIFLVNSSILANVDEIEGHPYGYTRTWIPDQLDGVWIYLQSARWGSLLNNREIKSGIWEN